MTCIGVDCSNTKADYLLEEEGGGGDFGAASNPVVEPYEHWSARKLAAYVEANGLKNYGTMIVTHKITGKVAPLLTDTDLKEMGMTIIGDRLRFRQILLTLGRKSRFNSRIKALWRGEEQRYHTDIEKDIWTCCGVFPEGKCCSLERSFTAVRLYLCF